MASRRTTRRGYLGALGAALATGLAGCSSTSDSEATPTSTPEPAATTATETPGPETEMPAETAAAADESPFTQVYRDTIDSVVLIRVSTGSGQGGQGSGFVYGDDYVVTNAHVVSDASNVQVRFSDGEWRAASVVGTDLSSDLAVVEVEDRPDYAEPLSLVDGPPAIGTEVVAIGSPYGFEGSLTSGLVSGVNRSIPAPNGYTIPDAIQTSAPVNPGNSGGPLVNLDGEVAGVINSGGGDNLAFAISAALVKRVVPSLIETGEYEHAYMGVGLATVTPGIAEQVGLDQARGVAVGEVLGDGPSAGVLRTGDIVLRIADQRIDGRQQLASYLALETSPGDTVPLTVLRDGERRTVELTLGERPERPDASP